MASVAEPARFAPGWRIWTASGAMMLCSLLSYIDRQTLAVLSPTILAETGMTAESYATVVSAFSIAYMIANPLWGSLLDYIGLRRGMFLAVGLWTLASTSHAFMAGFLGFAVARAMLGLGEGATFPGGFRASLDSLPPAKQARGIALSYSGGSLGAILTPLAVIPIAAALGWQTAFLLTGALGALWLVLWWRVAKPPFLPEQERTPQKIVLPNLLERRFWALVSAYAVGAFALGPVLYLTPLYLNEVLGVSQEELGYLLWIPPAGWEIGYFFWGWASDRFSPGDPRPVKLFLILTILSLPMMAATLFTEPVSAALLFAWATFVTAGFIVVGLRAGALAYPQQQSAMVSGMAAGSWSALLAVLLPVLGAWFDEGRYTQTFVVIGLMPVIGTSAWLLLTRPESRARG